MGCAQHLSKLAELIFGKAKQKATAWFEKWKCKLKQEDNAIRRLIMSAQRYAKHSKLRTDIQREIGFFQRNKKLMNYRFFLSKGYPIGSGPTEAACKTIVKQRMCRSGMR